MQVMLYRESSMRILTQVTVSLQHVWLFLYTCLKSTNKRPVYPRRRKKIVCQGRVRVNVKGFAKSCKRRAAVVRTLLWRTYLFSSTSFATSRTVPMFFFMMVVTTEKSATHDPFFEDVLWKNIGQIDRNAIGSFL